MNRILAGLRVIESSAFIAAPYAGMTLAQLGADVIRVDPPGGGLDYRRWPVTDAGASLYWAGLNKAKRSVCIDIRKPEGRDLLAALIAAPGETGGIFLTNLPAPAPVDYDTLRAPARRPDHGVDRRQPRRHHGGRLHGERGGRLSAGDRP